MATALTRRRLDTEQLESYGIYDGDVCVGGLKHISGTGGAMLWQWSCGFYPGCDLRTQMSSGNEDTYDEAKAAFERAWEKLEPQITPAMRDEWLHQQAFTTWKYAMQKAGCRMPTQRPEGWSHCFCGARITIAGVSDHVRAVHMGTNRPHRT